MNTISRKEAKALGFKRYFTGKACKHGHVAEHFASSGGCVECSVVRARAYYAANLEQSLARLRVRYAANSRQNRAYARDYQKANPEKIAAKQRLRKARKLRAVPIWACKESIESVYAEAHRLTIDTGISHHVDHIVPLKSPIVCGLHVHYNLRPIPAVENLKKGNRLWPL